MTALQAETAHEGVAYDLQMDTPHTESLDCARLIAVRIRQQLE